mmetsp:Transcript_55021/g.178846  ORF Transcript_55021/g.178846 Transcript_55021/m.178846 type:complete len:316 (+) Transcript_55021:320-1267(+)
MPSDRCSSACTGNFSPSTRWPWSALASVGSRGSAVWYLVLIGQNLTYLLPFWPYRAWVLSVTGLVLPVAFVRDLSVLERMSCVGVVASVLYGVCIVTGSFQALGQPSRHLEIPPSFETVTQFLGVFFSAMTIMAFGFGPVDILTSMRSEMSEPALLRRSLVWAHGAALLVYWVAGAFGFWGFGAGVAGNVNLSMCDDPGCPGQHGVTTEEGGSNWISGVALAIAVIANLAVTVPLILNCLFKSVEADYPADKPMKRWPNALMRAGTVLFSSAVGLCLPFFIHIVAIISSALGVPIIFFLPLMISWKECPSFSSFR